ncbi:MAG TPA: squalene--hopene cyclase [Thermodesulfobacteriota bacterium]|nr:squalene--hopene cyclase [Thermodesulfobacteriota bacterium]
MRRTIESEYLAQSLDQFGQLLFDVNLEQAIIRARETLLNLQHPDGYWCFELEADCTIPAEYILMMHYMDEIDEDIQAKLAVYLRAHQSDHGGWPLFHGGKFDMSCSVKAYYALKLAGDRPEAPHMVKAQKAILNYGGAARCNVFTRITLALFNQIPWRGVPFIPVELILLPRWFPFHISKVSYWSRTVAIPLTILCSLKPRAKNPKRVNVRELFTTPPETEKKYFPVRSHLNYLFLLFDRFAHLIEPLIPKSIRRHAVKKAKAWFLARLNGTDGLGAIFPAMVNAHEALDCLGYPSGHPYRIATKQALKNLLIARDGSAYCQPCVSPVWDTALACLALQEERSGKAEDPILRALDWLRDRQLVDEPGDWREHHPELQGGGWPFQFNNSYYPDLDDTAVVACVMHLVQAERYREAVQRATGWICGMQSKNGGFASFDSDNTHYCLNEIPFADHGALLDPPTSDVSARCATLLVEVGHRDQELTSCIDYLRKEQEQNGSWFGRWGTNYIYGTWSVLVALEKAGDHPGQPHIQAAVSWLKRIQRPDGGWGEDCDTYYDPEKAGQGCESTSFQTAWAMLGLMAAGEVNSPEVFRGAQYLLRTQLADGLWRDDRFTAPGFPRVFYLRYHGYSKYFPLWALSRYRNLRSKNLD